MLNKWGFERRIKVSEAEFIIHRWIERGARGKNSEFTLRGRYVSGLEVEIRIKRSIHDIMSSESCGAATPPHLRSSTPELSTPSAHLSAYFLREYAEEVEAYKRRSSGIGNSTAEPQPQDDTSPKATASNGDSPEHGSQVLT
jgi:hypothetical protein